MFQNLRAGNTIYVLNKGNSLSLEKGTIVNVSLPVPKYPLATTFGNQEMLVDIVVKINNQEITYQKLPANSDIADFGNTGIACLIDPSQVVAVGKQLTRKLLV